LNQSLKALSRAQRVENVVLKSRELYYVVSIYNYYQLTLFLVLIGKFDQKSNFIPNWPELGHIRAEKGSNGEKTWFSRAEGGIT